MKTVLKTLAIFLFCSPILFAQECKLEQITPSHKSGRYLDNQDGTITDIENALMWHKCSVGQTFDEESNDCLGEPTIFDTWASALVYADENRTYGEFDNWRMPNITQLSSLVERACFDPAISLAYFRSTPSAVYWSTTPDRTLISDGRFKGRVIDFTDGAEFPRDVTSHKLIRMVRPLVNDPQQL